MKVVFLSHTAMGGSFVVGSHHYAKALALAGHTVTHLSAPVSFAHVVSAFRDRFTRTRMWRWVRGGQIFDGVHDVIPLALIPWPVTRLFPGVMSISSTLMVTMPFRGFALRTVRAADWLIVDDPRLVGLALQRTAGRVMYRATDLYAEMGRDPSVLEAEKLLCKRADVLVATSDVVAEHLKKISGRSVDVIRNGVDFELFSAAGPLPIPAVQLPGSRNARAVYVGSFDGRFGIEAFKLAAQRLPDRYFVLIGPGSPGAAATVNLGNVTALGAIPYAELPPILKQCAVGLLPLSSHAANAGRSPMKLYEYAAAGLAVAATATRELSLRSLVTLSRADYDHDFPLAVRRAFDQSGDPALIELARQQASRESWVVKARQLSELLTLHSPQGHGGNGESCPKSD